MRYQRSLAGHWQFQLDPEGTLTVDSLAPDRSIEVPLPWQAAFPELQDYSGYAWYRTSVELDSDWLEGQVLLHFGAVDYWCQVFVNGQLTGEHEGGYTPFSLPIAAYLQQGPNQIAVRVYDATKMQITIPRRPEQATGDTATPPFNPNNIPHGKQEWYINVGGIWQDVRLLRVPKTYIDTVYMTPNIHSGHVDAAVSLAGDSAALAGSTLQLTIRDKDGATWQSHLQLAEGQQQYRLSQTVDHPHLWHIDDPYLYSATVSLDTSRGSDHAELRFGFREIATRDGQLLLNGEPIFLLAALDQDLYPDTIYTVPSDEFLRDQFQKAKHLGFNCLRCHIKPPDPRYLDLADELGLLVWAEIPSWRTFRRKGNLFPQQLILDRTVKRRVERTLEEMIQRDFNHPSLVIWTIVNEDWGTALPLSAADRDWVAALYDRCRQLDPTRLIVDNSPCVHAWGPNIHVKSDLDDFHLYTNIPDQARHFEQMVEQFCLRPLWTYSSHGDAERRGDEPLILSEFGNWGLPSPRLLRQPSGSDPDWFRLGPWWSAWEGEPGWPLGIEKRFRRLGLDAIWQDVETFATATQWHQFTAMKFEIEALRRQPALAGYVITELTDAYWESNGLLDFHRNPKAYHDCFASINALDMVIPRPAHYACWDDQQLEVNIHGAHYSSADWSQTQLYWQAVDEEFAGQQEVPALPRGSTAALGTWHWPLPKLETTRTLQFDLRVEGSAGQLARNNLEVLVLPTLARQAHYQGPLAVIESANNRLGSLLTSLGYQTKPQLSAETEIAVANTPTAELLRWVRAGGRLLFLSSGPGPFFWVQNRGGAYSGKWITNFSWLRPGIYRRLTVANPLSLPFIRVMPQHTILGLPVEDPAVQGDYLAGMVAGWIHHPAVHTVQFRYGRGRVIMTTFAVEQALGSDPVAIALFHDLLDHLSSEACQPVLAANY